jgi:hypothetical protein
MAGDWPACKCTWILSLPSVPSELRQTTAICLVLSPTSHRSLAHPARQENLYTSGRLEKSAAQCSKNGISKANTPRKARPKLLSLSAWPPFWLTYSTTLHTHLCPIPARRGLDPAGQRGADPARRSSSSLNPALPSPFSQSGAKSISSDDFSGWLPGVVRPPSLP